MDEQKIIKKRGRPRKNTIPKKIDKKLSFNNDEINREEEIILHLKLVSDDESVTETEENNFFSLNDSDNQDFDLNSSNFNKVSGSDKKLEIEDLFKELEKKEVLIKQLTEKVNYMNTYGSFHKSDKKEIITKYKNMNLINIHGNSITIPENTNIKCWHCANSFDNPPCFIPDRYINNIFHVFGNFCSFNCAASYNWNYLNDSRVKQRHSLILIMFHKIFGKKKELTFAPKKELLNDFMEDGLTIEEYRHNFNIISKEYNLKLPPMIPLIYEMEIKSKDIIETKILFNN